MSDWTSRLRPILAGLSDVSVDLTTLTTNHVLTWDGKKWVNSTASGGVSDGDKGDITVSGSGATWTIDSQAVTYSKIQNVSATDKVLGRSTAGAGTIEEITCTSFGRSLIDDANAAAGRTTLGLGTAATSASTDFAAASHTHAATDIGTGSVDNTEFGYLNGVTSAIQTQIDAKAAKTPQFVTLATDGGLDNERVLTAGNHVTLTDAGAGSTATVEWKHNPLRKARFWTEGASAGDFSTVSSGTSAGVTANATNADPAHPGVLSAGTGTTTTGRACSCYIEASAIQLGTYAWRSVGCFMVYNLSDGTETYSLMIGFNDTFTSPSPVDAVALRYQHSVNSGKFEAVTSSNSSRTATDTGVTFAANTWYSYEINVNAAGTSVEFKINGSVVATNTTNIPTGSSRVLGHGHNIVKSAGTTGRVLLTDCCLVEGEITR